MLCHLSSQKFSLTNPKIWKTLNHHKKCITSWTVKHIFTWSHSLLLSRQESMDLLEDNLRLRHFSRNSFVHFHSNPFSRWPLGVDTNRNDEVKIKTFCIDSNWFFFKIDFVCVWILIYFGFLGSVFRHNSWSYKRYQTLVFEKIQTASKAFISSMDQIHPTKCPKVACESLT